MSLKGATFTRWLSWGLLLALLAAPLQGFIFMVSQAAASNCPNISPLPCNLVKRSPDVTFNFDGSDEGLTDKNSVSLGFTMVDPPTYPGNPNPNPYAPGYWPDRLEISNGQLVITPTKGINYSTVNSQDNALGIGLDLGGPVSIQTSIGSLPAPVGGFAQAGIWFGKSGVGPSGLGGTGSSEDNYVKLIVISQANSTGTLVWEVQMLWEVDGLSQRSANQTIPNGSPVTLYLEINPSLHTINSRYCTVPGCDPKTAPIFQTLTDVPSDWFSADAAGIDYTVGTRMMGGIYASRRSAPVDVPFAFSDFRYRSGATILPVASKDGIDFDAWNISGINNTTAMAWGPDNRLYVATVTGEIRALTFDYASHTVASVETISAVQYRLALGLTIDPDSTPNNVILWVAHSDLSQNNGAANSGTVSRLSGPGFAVRQDVITGLPRAIANHATNSIHFGPDGKLYIAQAGNTGAGASNDQPSEFGSRPEQPLSSAILVADVKKPGFDGTCTSQIDPDGSQMDATGIAATDAPCDVQVYASGLRNPYDFVFASNGQMYATENGLGALGSFPNLSPDPLSWNPANGCTGMIVGAAAVDSHNPGNRPDLLQRVVPGGWYGHPNPSRNQCIFFGGNPTGGSDYPVPTTSDVTTPDYMDTGKYPVGRQPALEWRQPMFSFGANKSVNGIIEYNTNGQNFCGKLDGELLATYWSQGDQVRRLTLSPNGQSVISDTTLIRTNPANGGSFLVDPLPIVQDPSGRLYVGEFSGGSISVFEPVEAGFWQTSDPKLPNLPQAILDAGSGVVDGKLYAVAGKTASTHLRSLYVFDPLSAVWTQKADLPAAYPLVENPAVVSYAGKLYVFGGSTDPFSGAAGKAAVYDPASDTWAMLPDMPTPRGGPTAQEIGGKIYVAGGMNDNGDSLATLEVFDVASQTWTSGPNLSVARDNPGSAAVNGKLYIFGGRTRLNNVETAPVLNSVEIFTPGQGWTTGSPMPTARRTMATAVMNGEIIVMGGERTPTGGTFPANEAYDPAKGKWRLLTDMPVGRHGAIAGVLGDILYIAGGGVTGGSSFSSDMDGFYFACNAFAAPAPQPDLILSKTHSGSFSQGQTGAAYTLRVTNQGGGATSGPVTVTDTLPAGLTATAFSGGGWACTTSPLRCQRSDSLPAGQAYPDITLAVNVAANAPAQVTNEALVAGGGDANPANNTASDVTVIGVVNPPPDLAVSKTHVGSFTQGQVGAAYTLTVTNQGGGPSAGPVTVTDTLPTGLTATAFSGGDWACTTSPLRCQRSDSLPAGQAYPAITLAVDVAANAPAQATNLATVAGGGDLNPANNTAGDPTVIAPLNPPADLTLSKSHTGSFAQGQVGAVYTLQVSNVGAGPGNGLVTVDDTLPAGLTATAFGGSGWTCTTNPLHCERADSLPAGQAYPVITLTVNVAANAPAQVTNTATVAGGGENNLTNNTASDPTTISSSPAADLAISKTHTGSFTQGQSGAIYTLRVSNVGTRATSGVITVQDTLPAGLTASSIRGTGWTCSTASLSCYRSTKLYPGQTYTDIALAVNVAADAPAQVTNTAAVSGGGDANPANNIASDVTAIAPGTTTGGADLTISKTHSGGFTQGQSGAIYTLRVSNIGDKATSGVVTVQDTVPAGLTVVSIKGANWTCSAVSVSCYRSTKLQPGQTYPDAITLTVNVNANAPSQVTNTAGVSGGSEVNPANNTASDVTSITPQSAAPGPNLRLGLERTGKIVARQQGVEYAVTVLNDGDEETSGEVKLTLTLAAGLHPISLGGEGWTCAVDTLTCTRADPLGAYASYPLVFLTLDVGDGTPTPPYIQASVSGGGELDGGDDSAQDPPAPNVGLPQQIFLPVIRR